MGADRPDDFDVPSDDGAVDRGGGDSGGRLQVEVRDRLEYFESLRTAVRDAYSVPTSRANASNVSAETSADAQEPWESREPRESHEPWDAAAERFRTAWAEHRARWPAEAREPVDRSGDPEGTWRGDSGRYLDSAANAEVEKRCDQIAEAERDVVSPAMRQIEACDPDRQLVGFEHRLKGLDRIKDKVAATLEEQPDITSRQAVCDVPDSIRYTFQYSDVDYVKGVTADIARLKGHGFELVEVKNSWDDGQYKGINSRWLVVESEERFEVQFHTEISFEAKQLTHMAYEQVRNPLTTPAELRELRNFQQEITNQIPIPPGASEISGHPGGCDVEEDHLLCHRQ